MMGEWAPVHMYRICKDTIYVPLLGFYRAIKVWDFQAALDPRAPTESLCVRTLMVSIRSYGTHQQMSHESDCAVTMMCISHT